MVTIEQLSEDLLDWILGKQFEERTRASKETVGDWINILLKMSRMYFYDRNHFLKNLVDYRLRYETHMNRSQIYNYGAAGRL